MSHGSNVMPKNKHYWPHPSDLRNDRRVRRLMKDLPGMVGYGVAVITIERLRCEPDYSYPLADLDLLADEFAISVAILQTVISQYDLFDIRTEDDGEMVFSPLLDELMEPYIEKVQQAKRAGQISAQKRKLKQLKQLEELSHMDSDERSLNAGSTEENRKEENRKEKNTTDNTALDFNIANLLQAQANYAIYSEPDQGFIAVAKNDSRLIALAADKRVGRIRRNGKTISHEDAELLLGSKNDADGLGLIDEK